MNKILQGGNKMFELFLMKAMMEEVNEYLDKVINDIQAGELEGIDARIVVDDAMERAYGTRKGALILIDTHSKDGLTDKELETSQEIINWASEIITKCHVADELLGDVELDFVLGQDLEEEDNPFGFDFDTDEEDEDEEDCENCPMQGLCNMLNGRDDD